jgi:hypothetical protein
MIRSLERLTAVSRVLETKWTISEHQRGLYSSSGVHSQLFLASRVKSVSAWIRMRNGFSSCIHGIPGDLPTSITNSFNSCPFGPTKGLPMDTIRARPDRNLTPSGLKKNSLCCPAGIVIRVPGRREPSGKSSCCVPGNAVPALIKRIKNSRLADTLRFPKGSIFSLCSRTQRAVEVYEFNRV